jgi:hypothetical protein
MKQTTNLEDNHAYEKEVENLHVLEYRLHSLIYPFDDETEDVQ